MPTMTKQQKQYRAACMARDAKAAKVAAMAAQHAAHKAAVVQWENAYVAWAEADYRGPRPVDPRGSENEAGWQFRLATDGRVFERTMRDADAPSDADYDDLMAAAAEIGIDIRA